VVEPAGVSATFQVGSLFIDAAAIVELTGITLQSTLGKPLVYGEIDTNQIPNYATISTSQTPGYTPVSTSQAPNYQDIAAGRDAA